MNDVNPLRQPDLPDTQRTRLLRRATYARALGVDVWAARKKLVGVHSHLVVGGVSPATPEQPHREAMVCEATVREPMVKAAKRSRVHQELVNEMLQPDPVVASRVVAHASPRDNISITTQSSNLGPFNLFAKVADNLLLVDDLTQMQAASSAYTNWLTSVLLSIGKPPATLRASDRLRWPEAMGGVEALQNQSTQQQRELAQDLVSTWLLQKIQKASSSETCVDTLLLMGDASVYLFDADYLATLANTNRFWQQLHVVRTPSTVQLWAEPTAKKQFWQQLASLMHSVS